MHNNSNNARNGTAMTVNKHAGWEGRGGVQQNFGRKTIGSLQNTQIGSYLIQTPGSLPGKCRLKKKMKKKKSPLVR